MKVTCLPVLLLMVSCAALIQETSYAASPQHASDTDHPHSRAGLIASNRPKQLPATQKRLLPRNAASLRQPASARSGAAAKSALIQNETAKHALLVRSTSARPSVGSLNSSLNPLPNLVRYRGSNPAVVGGLANSDNSNTGAINGTGMHRRP
jgi:hypothetical protein